MNLRSAAQIIRDTVSMETILELYGYTTKRGFMVCPFHADGDASLKIYRNREGHGGWHCFGCGAGGSCIDFVMMHEGCDFTTAVRAIDKAAGLGLVDRREDPLTGYQMQSLQHSADAFKEAVEGLISGLQATREHEAFRKRRQAWSIELKPKAERSRDEWTELEYLKLEISKLDDEREQLELKRREVSEWRRKIRLLTAGRAQSA